VSYHREILEACGYMRRILETIEGYMREEAKKSELSRVQELAGINVSEEEVDEKWGVQTKVSPSEKGKYKGKSIEDLRSSLAALKKSGPHKQGSPEFGRMRELQFAIRAKTGWGKVGSED
jgi:hypothetical protein